MILRAGEGSGFTEDSLGKSRARARSRAHSRARKSG